MSLHDSDISHGRRLDASDSAAFPSVHFFKKSRRRIDCVRWPSVQWVFMIWLVPFAISHWLGVLGTGFPSRLCWHATWLLVACWVVFRLVCRAMRRRRMARNADGEPDASVRFACVGAVEDITRHGTFHDTPFEPVIFKAGDYGAALPSMGKVTALCVLLAIPAAYYVLLALSGIGGPVNPFERFSPLHGLALGLGAGVGLASAPWLCPAYFRIAPGCLDILCFSAFRKRVLSIRRVPLQQSRIMVDLRRSIVFIDYDEEPAKDPVQFSFRRVREKTHFAYTFLLAAMSTSMPPSLPDDELLG